MWQEITTAFDFSVGNAKEGMWTLIDCGGHSPPTEDIAPQFRDVCLWGHQAFCC